jgi:hypothetical protein
MCYCMAKRVTYKWLASLYSVLFFVHKSASSAAPQIPLCRMLLGLNHWLIDFIETKAKCRHLKKLTSKGTLRQVFIRVYRLEIHVGIHNPALWTIAPLTFSLVQLSPLPHFHVLYTGCKEGVGDWYGVMGLRRRNTCLKVPLQFFWMTTFCIAFYESYLGLNPRLLHRLHWQLMTSP